MLHTDVGMFRVTAVGLYPEEFITFHCVLNVCSFEALLLCLSHFRKGTNSSLARRHWLAD